MKKLDSDNNNMQSSTNLNVPEDNISRASLEVDAIQSSQKNFKLSDFPDKRLLNYEQRVQLNSDLRISGSSQVSVDPTKKNKCKFFYVNNRF